jgi:NADH-quinone oxidoreductase subunit K
MPPIFTQHPLESLLTVSAFVFCCGIFTILTRRNAVSILMGVELVLNAANLNFIAFAQFGGTGLQGTGVHGVSFVLFVILLAAAEAAVALAIIIGIYQNFGKIDVDKATLLKE